MRMIMSGECGSFRKARSRIPVSIHGIGCETGVGPSGVLIIKDHSTSGSFFMKATEQRNMEEYIQQTRKTSKNNYPHNAELYYPYGYEEDDESKQNKKVGYEVDIHFKAPHMGDVLYCQVMNGELNGPFELHSTERGETYVQMTGTMVDGRINGVCEIFDPYKGKIFEGTWEDGKRCGTCIEYEFGNVSFQGSYRDDKRNGYGWEYHDNELQREGEWRNGVYQQTYEITNQVNFVDSGLGMIVSDVEGDFLITCVAWEDSKKNGRAFTYSRKEKRVVQERLYMQGDEIDRVAIPVVAPAKGSLALENGLKWEGDVVNGMCNGDGRLTDANGNVIYEGSMFRNMRYGDGTSFVEGRKEFEGMWQMDTKMGDGTQFGRDGQVEKQGVWIDGRFAEREVRVMNDHASVVSSVLIASLTVGDAVLNDFVEIAFPRFSMLETVSIGSESLKELSEMNLCGLQQLRSLTIGSNSVTLCINVLSPIMVKNQPELVAKTISNNENRIRVEMKSLVISDCPKLDSVVFKQGVCSDFFVFTLENLPKLRVLEIGEISAIPGDKGSSNCFYYASNLEVMNCPSLERLVIGNRCFCSVQVMRLHNLPKLKTLLFGSRACFGHNERGADGKMAPMSRMSIRDCPSVEEVKFNNNFVWFKSVCFENVPKCQNVECVSKCFPRETGGIEVGENVSEALKKVLL